MNLIDPASTTARVYTAKWLFVRVNPNACHQNSIAPARVCHNVGFTRLGAICLAPFVATTTQMKQHWVARSAGGTHARKYTTEQPSHRHSGRLT